MAGFLLNDKFKAPITSPNAGGTTNPGELVTNSIELAFAVAGVIILFMLVLGGLGMIKGAGSNNPEAAAKGKKAVTYAVTGFLVVFSAYWVIQLIEYITGSTFVTNPSI